MGTEELEREGRGETPDFKALVLDRTLVLHCHRDRMHSGGSPNSGVQPLDLGSTFLLDSKGIEMWGGPVGWSKGRTLQTTPLEEERQVVMCDTVQLGF